LNECLKYFKWSSDKGRELITEWFRVQILVRDTVW
jgi:hypothetical protein